MTKARDLSQAPNASFGMKNRIINGDCRIDQRNAGSSVTYTTAGQYCVDRWKLSGSAINTFSAQQNAGSVTPPVGFRNYLGLTSLASTAISSGSFFYFAQAVEGFNLADLNWGTANAQPVTLSFIVRSSVTGTFGGSLINNAGDRSYPFTFVVNSTNTWETKTITIVGDTAGTWLTNNSTGVQINFSLGTGSTYSGPAGSWAGTLYLSASGAVSPISTNGATFYITGVQLEKGSTATSFDYRPYGTELALCQRYYYRYADTTFFLTSANRAATGDYYVNYMLPVTMRAKPTSTAALGADISGFNSVTTSSGYSGTNSVYMFFNSTGTGNSYYSLSSITASAEL